MRQQSKQIVGFRNKVQLVKQHYKLVAFYPACIQAKSLQSCQLCSPVICSLELPRSMGFSTYDYWSRLPCHFLQDIFLTQGSKLHLTDPTSNLEKYFITLHPGEQM